MSGGILSPRAVTAGGERFAVRTNRSETVMRDFMLGVLLLSSLLLFFYGVAENLSGVPGFNKSYQAYDRSPQSPLPGKADSAQKIRTRRGKSPTNRIRADDGLNRPSLPIFRASRGCALR